MTSEVPGQNAGEGLIADADRVIFDRSMQILAQLEERGTTISGEIPPSSDSSLHGSVLIQPYYMNSSDPVTLGQWRITVGDMNSRLHSVPSQDGERNYKITVADPEGTRKASTAEAHDIAVVLGLIIENQHQLTYPRKIGTMRQFARSLLRRSS